ncbi:MAG: hypothetical protein Q7U15_05995 [Methylotenera sp.]|nr:hypothetical protein [Methylotenera sp.]
MAVKLKSINYNNKTLQFNFDGYGMDVGIYPGMRTEELKGALINALRMLEQIEDAQNTADVIKT